MSCNNCNPANTGNNCNCSSPIALPIGPSGAKGTTGTKGADGTNGTNGFNAYTLTTATFVQPSTGTLGATSVDAPTNPVTISVSNTGQYTGVWASWGQIIWITTGGYYLVHSATATSMVVVNTGYSGNAAPGLTIASAVNVSPAGIRGVIGLTGATGANGSNGNAGSDGISFEYLGRSATAPVAPNDKEFYYNTTVGATFFWDDDTSTWEVMALDGSDGTTVTTDIGVGGSAIVVNATDARQQIITSTGTVTITGNVTVSVGTGVFQNGHTITVIYKATLVQSTGTVTLFGTTLTNAQALAGNLRVLTTYNGTTWYTQIMSDNSSDIIDSGWIEVTTAQLLTSFSSPKTFIAAPGSGKYIHVLKVDGYNKNPGAGSYSATGTDTYDIMYNDAASAVIASGLHTFLESGAADVEELTSTIGFVMLQNKAIIGKTTTADLTTGTWSMYFRFLYKIITLP